MCLKSSKFCLRRTKTSVNDTPCQFIAQKYLKFIVLTASVDWYAVTLIYCSAT